MPANKVKGLLKGLRYISQVFDNEKEPEMQIGHPTDVKHVAHIGCDGTDGQSGNPPAWMREFGPPPSFSGPLTDDGEISQNGSAKWSGEDSSSNQRSGRPPAPPSLDIPEKPRSSRRQSLPSNASNRIDSPKKSKSSDKPKTSRRSNSSSQTKESSPGSSESPARNMSEKLPKKSRERRQQKEGGGGGGSVRTSSSSSSRSKAECCESSYACTFSDPGPRNDDLPPLRSPLKSYGGGEHHGYF